jgi:hypothetical protein
VTASSTPFTSGSETPVPAPLRRTFITLAQVDGARKDILEAISHGPRGDIVSVYTTFRSLHVTGEQSSRNRWTKSATPAGHDSI